MGINILVSQCWSGLMLLLLLSQIHIGLLGVTNAQLSQSFYDTTCPNAISIIQRGVQYAVALDDRMGASLLRLHFADCFVNGCDASVLLDDTADFTGEKTAAPNNNSLRGFDVIDTIKAELEMACPGVVSCADVLTVAATESVVLYFGPRTPVWLGRRDSTTASLSDANSQIPSHELNLDALISAFATKGFSPEEMVTLSGAHTIGSARCITVRNKIYNETNIDPSFAAEMRSLCPGSGGDDGLLPLDATTTAFDNFYFRNLVAQRGLLHSDQQLLEDESTSDLAEYYIMNPDLFFNVFAVAMVKMSYLSPLTGADGEIRTNCRSTNSFRNDEPPTNRSDI